MPESQAAAAGHLGAEAQQRLERWLLSPELRQHMQDAGDRRHLKKTGPFIAISRQSGADGTQIARLVGEELGWDVLDKELLDFMAERYDMPRGMLEFVDEAKSDWVRDVLGAFVDSHVVTRDKFVAHLQRIICLAAVHGKVVFVGRSAHVILPREHGLAVRVIAPKSLRIERVMERRQLNQREAAAKVDEVDQRRKQFCQHYFHYDIDDPLQYDLVVNTARVTAQEAAQMVIRAFREVCEDIP